jgi:hypothetical protein
MTLHISYKPQDMQPPLLSRNNKPQSNVGIDHIQGLKDF